MPEYKAGELPEEIEAGIWIRYFFRIDPWELEDFDFWMLWREAQYLLKMLKPIQPDK